MKANDDLLAILSEPRRQAILRLVWREERSAGEIAAAFPDVTFGAVSQHLRILRDARIVTRRAVGKHRLYRADHDQLGPLAAYLEEMWANGLSRLKALAEADEAAPADSPQPSPPPAPPRSEGQET